MEKAKGVEVLEIQAIRDKREGLREDFRKRIKRFILKLIRFVDALPRDRTCAVVGNQLMRSGTSIGANYFEARGASSRNDFTNFFNYSLKSANETMFWLETLIEAKKCNGHEAEALRKEVAEFANIFASSILTLKGKK